jgi:hypothetical protein
MILHNRRRRSLGHGRMSHGGEIQLWKIPFQDGCVVAQVLRQRQPGRWVAIIKDGGGNSSTGRAPDCGSDGCGFDSRFPPQSFPASPPAAVLERPGALGWTPRPPPSASLGALAKRGGLSRRLSPHNQHSFGPNWEAFPAMHAFLPL